jgi:predicted glycosyltransferase
MTTPLTIVFQPFATSWLGHTSRLIAIAQGVRRRKPDARLVFLAEGNASPLLAAEGFPHICLPPEAAFAGHEWSDWPADERDHLLGKMARSLLEELQPRLMVFDSRPCAYIAVQTAEMRLPTAFVARRTRTEGRCFDWAKMHRDSVDLVIVPHEAGEFPVPPELAEKTHFVGTIVRDETSKAATPPADTGKRVLITGGGGGFPGTVDFYNHALAAVRASRTLVPSLEGTLITGPMFNEWRKLKPVEGVEIVPFDADIWTTMTQADVIICQAGYNTLAELGRIDKPTICIPAPRVADDQFARARALVGQRKRFVVLSESSVEALRDQIIACLEMPSDQAFTSPAPAGADRAAELILSFCR